MQITTIGLDLAKQIFQVHAADASGAVVLRKRLRRSQVLEFFASLPPCLVGMEACATAHHWARELMAFGHEVRLMPPRYVKPYVKWQKNDTADAAAICEAVTRPSARQIVEVIVGQLEDLAARVGTIERQMLAWHKSSRRLATIPGIGPVVATAIAASVPDPGGFRSGRQFAAWLGLVPRQNSTGGKDRLGKISKQGNGYLRRLLINGAQSVLRCSKAAKHDLWLMGLLARWPRLVTAVALANKTARIAWAVMARENEFRRSPAAA